MQAIVQHQYGAADQLSLKAVERPTPGEKEVLVRVITTAINDFDWSMVSGKPFLYRLMFGLRKPKYATPGIELAGVVEAVGPGVSRFQPGDAVYGDTSNHGFGTFAEYMAVNEEALTHKPDAISFEEACSISHAALLALQGVQLGQLGQGQKLLINGAGGGVGTFALQLAKLQGATVTGVDTGKKLEAMRQLGFDQVIDYKQQDFTRDKAQYDLILDCKTNRPPGAYSRVLHPKGHYVTVGGKLSSLFLILLTGALRNRFGKRSFRILGLKPNRGLDYIHQLIEKKQLRFLIDGPYPMEKIPWAIDYFGAGLHTGKIVIRIAPNQEP